MSDSRLAVLTFNCWGLKFVSKNRRERIVAIAVELGKSNYDIILLQELWVQSDYELMRENVSLRLPYSKTFYSGALGAGLVIFSRFPIVETSIHRYSLAGAPIDVSSSDWMVGKSAASVVISHPILRHVQIFNTHFCAKEEEHQVVNAWELSKLALQAAQLGRHVIVAGDLNSLPSSLPMIIIRDHAGLADAWTATEHQSTIPTSSPPNRDVITALDAIHKYGVTVDSPRNTYSAGKRLDSHAIKYSGKRLDYILYRQPILPMHDPSASVLKATDTKVVLTDTVPQYDFSYSDHFGLECTFEIGPPDAEEVLSSSSFAPSRETTLSPGAISTTMEMLSSAFRSSRSRAHWELTVFVFCLVILIGLIVGSTWLPHSWINPIFLLFTIFITWLGTTMLYEGFIYGRWEQNALISLVEELEIHKKAAELQERHSRRSESEPEDDYGAQGYTGPPPIFRPIDS